MTSWPDGYLYWPSLEIAQDGFTLRPLRWEDREPIRRWRNAQIDVLRQASPLSEVDQDRYFSQIVRPQLQMENPPQILWALEADGQLIGYGGLVHIQWADLRAEVSFMTDPARLDPATFDADWRRYLRMVIHLAREGLAFHKLTTETYEIRGELIELLESEGFVREGVHPEHHRMPDRWVTSFTHGLVLRSGA